MGHLNFDFAARTVTVTAATRGIGAADLGARGLGVDVSSTGVVLPDDGGMPM